MSWRGNGLLQASDENPPGHRRGLWFWLMSILLLSAFFLHSYRLGSQSLWFDEILQLQLARASVVAILSNLRVHAVAPMYTCLLKVWIKFAGLSEFAVRFMPACAGVTGIALFYRYLKTWLSPLAALVGCVLLTLSPFYLYFSQEGRPYTLVVVSILATLLVFRRLLRERSGWWVVLHGLLLALTGYLHYTALVVVGGEALWVLVEWPKSRRRWKRVLASWVLASMPLLVLMLSAYQALQSLYGSTGATIGIFSTIQTVAAGFGKYGAFPDYDASFTRWAAPLLLLGLIAQALPAVRSARVLWAISAGTAGFQFGWTFVFLPLTGKLSNPSFNERHFLWAAPMVFTVTALGVQYGLRRRGWLPRALVATLVGGTVILYAVGDIAYFTRYCKNPGRAAIDFVVSQARVEDLILCNTRSAAASWTIYGDPQLEIWDKPKQAEGEWHFSPQVSFVIEGQVQWPYDWGQVLSHSRVWVLYLPGQGPPELMDSLRLVYTEEQAWLLGGVEVFLFAR